MSDYKVIFAFTHDSVGLGEDGPTHQPIEHLASLRAMPRLRLIRPADANETAQAWRIALAAEADRQCSPARTCRSWRARPGRRRAGAYVLADPGGDLDVVLVGTGSEVSCASTPQVAGRGLAARVVSMPSWDLFAVQGDDYQNLVLPPDADPRRRGRASFGWDQWADDSVSIDRYGASAVTRWHWPTWATRPTTWPSGRAPSSTTSGGP